MSLTDRERDAFVRLDADLPGGDVVRRSGVLLADRLRRDLPDVDDVTLGRVALQLMRHLGAAKNRAERDAGRDGLSADTVRAAVLEMGIRQLATAALTLTELEWRNDL